MRKYALLLWALILALTPLHADLVGTSDQTILGLYGSPQMATSQNGREVWIYANGARLIMQDGKVVEASGVPAREIPKPAKPKSPQPATPAAPKTVTTVGAEAPRSPTVEPAHSIVQPGPPLATAGFEPTPAHKHGLPKIPISAMILVGCGIAVGLGCRIWIIVLAFMESIIWGLATLSLPFASLVFIILHWKKTQKAFLINVGISVPLILAGTVPTILANR